MKTIKSICILGGGSAGWMTAALLNHQLPKHFQITLIESPNIPSVGVGEATLVDFNDFMVRCGYQNEADWIDEVSAIYKCGILFEDWVDIGKKIWHPFTRMDTFNDIQTIDLYYHANLDYSYEDFSNLIYSNYNLCVNNGKVSSDRGYHLDAIKLANFFRQRKGRVNHILSEYQSSMLDDKDHIKSITLTNGNTIESDLFIDCTGFKNVLSSQIDGAEWVSKEDHLLCNSAVACPVSYVDEEKEMVPYTKSVCQDNGWMWITPIQERIGTGIVYNRFLNTKDEVEKQFIDYWGEDRLINDSFNHLDFDPKYNSKAWRNNVLSIGLSSGFVEPLESSGLALIILSGYNLLGRIRKGFYTDLDTKVFNSKLSLAYEETFDFISIHYSNSKRDTPFWKKARENDTNLTETLQYKIENFKENGFNNNHMDDGVIFGAHSWTGLFEAAGVRGKPSIDIHNISPENAEIILQRRYKDVEKYIHLSSLSNYEILKIRKDKKGLKNE